jgi:hypothetical protein
LRLKSFVRFAIGVVVVGLMINILSDYVESKFPSGRRVAVQLTLLIGAAWVFVLLSRALYTYFTDGRYSVQALILNSRNELLLFNHPLHKVMLPPGGRVRRTEFPDDALHARLSERLDLHPRDYRFDPVFHRFTEDTGAYIGEVRRIPAPFMVQKELHRQRAFVRFHYDLLFVLRVVDDGVVLHAGRFEPTQWVNRDALVLMVSTRRTFPDVLDAYDRLLAALPAVEHQ